MKSPNYYGLCFGVGSRWQRVAALARERMEQMTGLPCLTVSDVPKKWKLASPHWAKLRPFHFLPRNALGVFYFDADIIPLKPWHPDYVMELAPKDLYVVHDEINSLVRMEEAKNDLPTGTYFNAGLWMAARGLKSQLEGVLKKFPHGTPKEHAPWAYEQTAMNVMFRQSVCYMPGKYNRIVRMMGPDAERPLDYPKILKSHQDFDTINLHVSGLGGELEHLESLWHTLERP